MRKNGSLRLLAGLALATIATADEGAVTDSSYRAPDGSRVLEQSVVVDAGLETVWAAFTTAEGLEAWAVPSAWVDFGVGGHWETSYDPDATRGHPDNIRSRILAYQPLRMIAIQAEHAPPGFPHPELLDGLFSVFTFEDLDGGGVRITAAGVGYAEGEGYDRLYEFFQRGNAWTLAQLRQRFESGPVNWEEKLRQLPDTGDSDPQTEDAR